MVVAEAKFLKWIPLYEEEKPFNIFIDIPHDAVDKRANNLVFEQHPIDFQDIRGQETAFSLDDNGFTFVRHTTEFHNFEDRCAVEQTYLPEVEQLIRENVEGADKIHVFDWRVHLDVELTLYMSTDRVSSGTAIRLASIL